MKAVSRRLLVDRHAESRGAPACFPSDCCMVPPPPLHPLWRVSCCLAGCFTVDISRLVSLSYLLCSLVFACPLCLWSFPPPLSLLCAVFVVHFSRCRPFSLLVVFFGSPPRLSSFVPLSLCLPSLCLLSCFSVCDFCVALFCVVLCCVCVLRLGCGGASGAEEANDVRRGSEQDALHAEGSHRQDAEQVRGHKVRLVDYLMDQLVGQWVGWSVGWLVGLLVDWLVVLVNGFVGWLVYWLVGLICGWLVGWSVG